MLKTEKIPDLTYQEFFSVFRMYTIFTLSSHNGFQES
jgi:hypothetical protein